MKKECSAPVPVGFLLPRAALGLALATTVGTLTAADLSVAPQGTEYAVSRGMVGDQTAPSVSINSGGGYAVWQDNAADGDGLGIGAAQLNGSLSPIPTRMFRVNQTTTGDQEKPQVQLLPAGGAVVVWQSGKLGEQDIYARFLAPNGTFATGEIRVNSFTAGQQSDAAVSVQADASVVIVWSSMGQDGGLQGVFGQRLSADGAKLGGEFPVNQFTPYNQRTPAVQALEGGDFVVAWVTEQQRFENSVDVFARRFGPTGGALGGEFRLNSTTNLCANPALAPGWNGGFVAAWSERFLPNLTNMWDVVGASFDASGNAAAEPAVINVHRPHNQFLPKIASLGNTRLIVWDSYAQDGNRDGVFGRLFGPGGATGEEFRVNTTTIGQQMQPAVAGDGLGRFLVAWSGYAGGEASFEIFAQRYAGEEVLATPAPPIVSALGSSSLMVSWAPLAGFPDLVGYRLWIDGSATPVTVSGNYYVIKPLTPATSHSVRMAYELTGGRVSPLSDTATGTTWGYDLTEDGLPDDWQAHYWGQDSANWPDRLADSDGDGASNLAEFQAGTDPTDPASALRIAIQQTYGGLLLQWNATTGSIYQLQLSTDLKTWADASGPSFAAGETASTVIPANSATAYYRVIRVR